MDKPNPTYHIQIWPKRDTDWLDRFWGRVVEWYASSGLLWSSSGYARTAEAAHQKAEAAARADYARRLREHQQTQSYEYEVTP